MKRNQAKRGGEANGLLAAVVVAAGIFGTVPSRGAEGWEEAFSSLPQVVDLLRQNYVDFERLDPAVLERAAVAGILRSLRTGARGYEDLAGSAREPALDGVAEVRFHAHLLPPDVGYLYLGGLGAATAGDMVQALAAWAPAEEADSGATAAAAKVGALVIDLRFVDSADLNAAGDVLEIFAAEGAEVFRVIGPQPASFTGEQAPSPLAAVPVVVVVNSETSLAGEAVAGALRELVDAVVIGEPTRGAGAGYISVELPEGGSVEMANAKVVFPSGGSPFPDGLEPDIKAAMDHELELKLLLYRIGVREEPADELSRALEEVRLDEEPFGGEDLATDQDAGAREPSAEEKERRRLVAEERKLLEMEHRFGLDRDTVLQRAVDLVRGLKALKFRS